MNVNDNNVYSGIPMSKQITARQVEYVISRYCLIVLGYVLCLRR